VPVIATRIAGVPELVEDGVSGFLVPPGEPRVIAERAALLLDDAELRNRMGAAGRAKVEREFNIAVEAQRLCRVMTSALGARVVSENSATEVATPAGVGDANTESVNSLADGSSDAWRAPAPAGA
jgi:hypothetical protein